MTQDSRDAPRSDEGAGNGDAEAEEPTDSVARQEVNRAYLRDKVVPELPRFVARQE